MSKIYSIVDKYIKNNNMIKPGDRVLAAVSGGADSMAMLILLERYCAENEIGLGVIHINHGFRPEAEQEAEYVASFCMQHNIPFILEQMKPGECAKTEEAARIKRYEFFKVAAESNGYQYVALAHNANDRAETLLFNMFRGTGLRGMAGIRAVRDNFIRPVMCLSRKEIEDFLSEQNIEFCTDKSNLEDDYSRNQIRHHILPVAEAINSESIEHLNRVAQRMEKLENYINSQICKEYDRLVKEIFGGYEIPVSEMKSLDELIASGIVRKLLENITPHLKDITTEHIELILSLFDRDDNARVDLPYSIKVYRQYEKVVVEKGNQSSDWKECNVDLEGLNKEIDVPISENRRLKFKTINVKDLSEDIRKVIPRNKYTKWFDYDKIDAIVSVRRRLEGDYLIIDEEGHTKSLSRYMIEEKIPERIRDEIPIIAINNEVLWVVGYRESCIHRINSFTNNILEINLED